MRRPALVAAALLAAVTAVPLLAQDRPPGQPTPETALTPGQLCAPDLRNMVRYQLRLLSDELGKALEEAEAIGLPTAAHYAEGKSQIDRTLEAPLVDVSGGGGTTIIMMGQEKE